MKWTDISLKKFKLIQDILTAQDEYTALNLIDLIYGVDSNEMPINELKTYSISFLNDEIPTVKINKQYTLNGRTYDSNFDLTVVNTALFIDYLNYLKAEKYEPEKVLSVFMVPEGHRYNDGYDMKEVWNDLSELDIATVLSIGFFFERLLKVFVSLFQYYLTISLKKMNIKDRKKKEEILKLLEETDLANLASFHLS